ncbi:immunoglobulin-like domain-containing protein, partial [Enterovibrio norvegicus]|uniref:immunoglobulin-like domain-containing protein n=1 Tax=Enterovibrio norvegicus TaxID=188144 RepID=UPI0015E4443C
VTVKEGSDKATITGSLDHTPKTDVTVTLSNGATLTFGIDYTPGDIVESTPFDINNGEDVVVDASDTRYYVTVTGGDFESLTSPDSVTVSVEDTNDTVTVKLTASKSVSEGGKITYTAMFEGGVAENDISVKLTNGETITITAGQTSGTVTKNVANDIYTSNNITNSIASVQESGDNAKLEDLQSDGKAVTTTVVDIIENGDAATLTLNNVTVKEGTDKATITGSLDQTPKSEVTVTLSNGATLTFGADYTPGTLVTSTPFDINNGEDVVVDASNTTYDVTVTGGDFESLTSPDSVTVSVEDTNDTVTVKLTASDKVNEGGKITYTATLEGGVAKNDITVTLANGETITIKANETSGEIDVTVENDIYASDNITNSIANVTETGSNDKLEDLQADGATVTTTVV